MEFPDLFHTQILVSDWLVRSVLISILAIAGTKMLGRWTSLARCRFLFGALLLLLLLPLTLPFFKLEVTLPWNNLPISNLDKVSRDGNFIPLLLVVWGLGTIVWMGMLVTGVWRLKKQLRSARNLREEPNWDQQLQDCCSALGLRKVPGLVLAKGRTMPCAVGLFKPTVVVPETASEWGHERREMVLLHELGHLKRGDLWLQWVSLAARCLYWFNPLVKSLHQALLTHREEACDALVVESGARPNAYARHLLEIASTHSHASALSPALAIAGRKSNEKGTLERRIVRLLSSAADRPTGRVRWLGVLLMTAVCIGALVIAFVVPGLTSGQELGTAPWTPEEVDLRWSADPFPTE